VKEFLEKNWTQGLTEEEAVKLTIKALLEVVDSGAKNMEIAVVLQNQALKTITEDVVQTIITDIEREQEEAKRTAPEPTEG
jgi:20S proteasome subunit alpha 4